MSTRKDILAAITKLSVEADYYDPGSVEIALDALASSLQKHFELTKLRKAPPLSDVFREMNKDGILDQENIEKLARVQEILDENSYPEGIEIEDPEELEELITKICESLKGLPTINETK